MYVIVMVPLVVLIIFFYYVHKFNYWKNKGVYYRKPKIPFGNHHPLQPSRVGTGKYFKDLYDEIKQMKKPYGGIYVGTTPLLLLIEPELIKTILIKDYKYFYDRGFHFSKHAWEFYQNLVVLFGKKWKRIRSKISPAFSKNKMRIIFDSLLECTENLDIVLNKPSNEPIDIKDIMSRLTLDNIALTTFGFHSDSLIKEKSSFYQYAHTFEKFLFKTRSTHLYVFIPELVYIISPFYLFSLLKIRSYFVGILKKNIKHREDNNVYKNDFLDLFIKLTKNQSIDDHLNTTLKNDCLSFNELAATAFSFYIGGYHTTESSLTFGLLQLALNQNVQNKLRKNINDTLGRHQGNVTYESVMEMEYLEQVIFEILRMYPIIPVLFRECNENYTVPNTNLIIDKGTKVWIPILGLHMDPEYYSNPTEFNPDRFTQEQIGNRKPFTYLPFGEGHRICIGKRFGLLQMKVALVKLIGSYRFTVDSKTILPVEFANGDVFLGPKNTIWLNVTKITQDISQ